MLGIAETADELVDRAEQAEAWLPRAPRPRPGIRDRVRAGRRYTRSVLVTVESRERPLPSANTRQPNATPIIALTLNRGGSPDIHSRTSLCMSPSPRRTELQATQTAYK